MSRVRRNIPNTPERFPIWSLALLFGVLLAGCCSEPSTKNLLEYFSRVLPHEIHSMYEETSPTSNLRDECVHHLLVCADYLDCENDDAVSYLLDIAESDPVCFFRVVAKEVCEPLYESWLGMIERACFTDFPGDRDLGVMEDRRLRVASKLRNLRMDERTQERARQKLVDLLENVRVRRID